MTTEKEKFIFGKPDTIDVNSVDYPHVEGQDLIVQSDYSTAIGKNISIPTEKDFSFVFNTTEDTVSPADAGTFSIQTGGKLILDDGETFDELNGRYLHLSGGTVNGLVSVSGAFLQFPNGSTPSTDIGDFSFQSGSSNTANGDYCHVEGAHNVVRHNGLCSHVEGTFNSANASYCHVIGVSANATSDCSFVWNGNEQKSYSDNGKGTFNINPLNGTQGLYFGTRSLCDLVHDSRIEIDANINSAENQISRAANLVGLDSTESSAIEGRKVFLGQIDASASPSVKVPTVSDVDDNSNRAVSTAFAWDSVVAKILEMSDDYGVVIQDGETAVIQIADKSRIRVYKNVHATSVGSYDFSNCPNLTYCILPNVIEIANGAFDGCDSVKQIYLGSMSSFAASGDWGLPDTCIPVS